MLASKGPEISGQLSTADKKVYSSFPAFPDLGVENSQEAVRGAKTAKHFTDNHVEPCMTCRVEGESRP